MASTSASSVQKSFKYDVFLSFRGEDVRKTFVDHLYHALHNRGITTYKDDEKIEQGKRIDDQLMRSIEDSRIYIIVFSKNYASSSWCLDELVKIMECRKKTKQTAYPVFFNVEPTEVRHQSGAVKEAFAKHEKDEAAGKWRNAMKEAADLAGRELKTTFDGHEAKFIQKVVEDISLELRFIDSSVDEKLIGMETRVKDVVSSLEDGSDDVHMIGIKGIGGGGKTTLARAVFDHVSIWFEGKSFVENVREVSKGSGLKELQKQVLKDVLSDQSVDVTSVSGGKIMMKKMMGSRKALVVLDDVDDIEQLEALAGEPTWFKPGSTIIITTRDEHVLVAHRVKSIHDVNLLSHEEGIRLFNTYAFGREIPIEGYEELTQKVVCYAAGLPLTIKVLGSSLCGKTKFEWNDAIERLKKIPEKQTLKRLELSYNGLEHDHKEVFLEVACILKGESKDKAIRILESCGFYARFALKVLEQKSLIIVSAFGKLYMHDRIKEMGRNIVRRLHPHEPQRHNRLWVKEEVENILVNELGTKETLSIKLMFSNLPLDMVMKGLRKMKKLRVLYISCCYSKINPANKLEMSCNNISQLWAVGKVLNELKYLGLNHSELRTFDLGMTPQLKTLDLVGCNNLVELHMPIESPKLISFVLSGSKLSKLDLGLTPQLETIDLKECNNLVELHMPIESPKLISFVLSGSKLSKLDLGLTPQLETIDLKKCNNLVELHMPVKSPKLNSFSIRWSKLSKLDLGLTPQLERIALKKCNNLVELYMPVESPKLISFVLSGSKLSKLNLGLTPQLEIIELKKCNNLVELHMPVESPKLNSFFLSGSKLSKLDMGLTPQLEKIDLEECNNLVELHMPVESPKLNSFFLSGFKLSKLDLGLTPQLKKIALRKCNNLVELHMPVESPKLHSFFLSGSKLSKLDMGLTPQLEKIDLEECNNLVELHMPVESPKLYSFFLRGSKLSKLDLGLTPQLEKIDLEECNNLVELHMPVESPKLNSFFLSGSKLSKLDMGLTPQLKEIDLVECNNLVELHMPVESPKLNSFFLRGSKLSKLDLGLTPQLNGIALKECYYLQEIHAPMGCLKKLVNFKLSGCLRFEHFVCSNQYVFHSIDSLATIKLTVESPDKCPLHPNNNLPKLQFKCSYDEPLPLTSEIIERLLFLGLYKCINPESFSSSICGLQHLGKLKLQGSIPEVPKDLYQLESLQELTLCMKEIKHLPDRIFMLKHLKYLRLESCWLLEQIPMDICRLECLKELTLTDCRSLREIPNICQMKCLEYLRIPNCILVNKLPEELGRLKCLEELNIEGTAISRLPQSFFELKGLRIIGSRWQLESYGFTPLSMVSRNKTCCYVKL